MINNNRPDNVSFTENRVCHCKTGIKRAACFFMIFAAVSLSGCNGNKNADNIQNAQSVNESNQNVPNTTAQTGSEENANVPNENAQNATAQTENIDDVRDNSADEDYDFTTFYSFIPYGDGCLKMTAYAENLQYNKLERMSKISADILKIGFADEANKAGYPGMLEKIEEINKSRFIHWESAASVISEKISKAGDEERRKMYDESPYYDISRVAVVRSDERIFSLVSTDESYMGEEERFTVQTANIDPVTGEEVDFNDLCTNRELLLQFAEKAAADHFSGDGISDNNETEKFMTEFNEMLSSGNVPFVIGNGGIGFYFGGQKPWSFFIDFSDGENRELYKSIFSKAYGMGAESYSIKLKEDIPYNVLFANDGKNGNVQFSLNQAYKDGILMVEKVILYADGREKAELEPVDADTVNAKLIVDPSGVYVCLTFTTPYESDGDGSFQRVYRIDGNSISYEDSLQVKNACDTVDLSDYPGFTEGSDIHVDIMDDSGLH